jgi:molecular chaperone DnaJ
MLNKIFKKKQKSKFTWSNGEEIDFSKHEAILENIKQAKKDNPKDKTINNTYNSFFDPVQYYSDNSKSESMLGAKGKDVIISVECSEKELKEGVEKLVKYSAIEKCSSCNGTGSKNRKYLACSSCNGKGAMMEKIRYPFGEQETMKACKVCKGMGKIPEDECSNCKGVSAIIKDKAIKILIPKNTPNNTIIKKKGAGGYGEKNYGDLVIKINL